MSEEPVGSEDFGSEGKERNGKSLSVEGGPGRVVGLRRRGRRKEAAAQGE